MMVMMIITDKLGGWDEVKWDAGQPAICQIRYKCQAENTFTLSGLNLQRNTKQPSQTSFNCCSCTTCQYFATIHTLLDHCPQQGVQLVFELPQAAHVCCKISSYKRNWTYVQTCTWIYLKWNCVSRFKTLLLCTYFSSPPFCLVFFGLCPLFHFSCRNLI